MDTVSSVKNESKRSSRQRSVIQFPYYGLADSVVVAQAIHNKAGGYATRDQLAAFLGYKSTANGAFLSRVSSAKLFGLIVEEDGQLRITPLAVRIIMPESPDQTRAALVEAFFSIPLYKAIYDEYSGRNLPEGLGLENALKNRFQVTPKRLYFARKTFFESAETAGFFETRGSKTQLIIPNFKAPLPKTKPLEGKGITDDSGSGNDEPPPPPAKSRDDLQNEYIATLIQMLRDKSKEGEKDKELMETIERLLNLKTA